MTAKGCALDGRVWSNLRRLENFGASAGCGLFTCAQPLKLEGRNRDTMPRYMSSTSSSLSKAANTRFVVDSTFEL